MVKKVIKKDGTIEDFDENKIIKAIEGAAEDVGIANSALKEIINQILETIYKYLGDKEEVQSDEISSIILSKLDEISPGMATAWRVYAKAKRQG